MTTLPPPPSPAGASIGWEERLQAAGSPITTLPLSPLTCRCQHWVRMSTAMLQLQAHLQGEVGGQLQAHVCGG